MSKEKLFDKIKKILDLANDNSTHPEESQSALLMAQRLMAQHNIEMSDVFSKKESKDVNDISITKFKKMPWWVKRLSYIISKNFRCTAYTSNRDGSSLHFIGLKEDTELAKSVYEFAENAIKHYSDAYVKRMQKEGWLVKGIRNDFIKGYLNGLEDKFTEQISKEGWGLIIVQDDAVVEFVESKRFKKGSYKDGNGIGNNDAIAAGYERGNNFNSPSGMIEK